MHNILRLIGCWHRAKIFLSAREFDLTGEFHNEDVGRLRGPIIPFVPWGYRL